MKLSHRLKNDSLPRLGKIILLFALIAALLSFSSGNLKNLAANIANSYWVKWAGSRDINRAYAAISSAAAWGQLAGENWRQSQLGQRVEQAWTALSGRPDISEISAWKQYQQAQSLENDGQAEEALRLYQQALSSPSLRVSSAYSAYRIAQELGEHQTAEETSELLSSLAPSYPVAVPESREMRIVGYDLNKFELDTSGVYTITLYWETFQPAKTISDWQEAGWSYIHIGQRLYQVGKASNLLVNGGFEQGLPGLSFMPTGYQNIKYARRSDRSYTQDNFGLYNQTVYGIPSQVLRIANQGEDLNGISTKGFLQVVPGKYYFLSGSMKAEELASGSIGGIWRDQQGHEISYWYIVREYLSSYWSTFAGVMQAPVGAEHFSPLVTNIGEGNVFLDNLQFFELPLPGNQVMK